ncbi:MAG: ECF-type sigma factor [Acidobacteriota bacterium]
MSADVSRLLEAWNGGDREALEHLTPVVAGELRAIARRHLRREGERPSLQPTELVHEAFLRLMDQRTGWRNRAHFLGVAAQAMRRILVDRGRRRRAAKRPQQALRVTLDGLRVQEGGHEVDVLDLHRALEELASLDPRAARVVELRSFGGCSAPEAAEVLGVSEATVARDWRMALTWLRRALAGGDTGRSSPPEPA